jgi:hypothetical protein
MGKFRDTIGGATRFIVRSYPAQFHPVPFKTAPEEDIKGTRTIAEFPCRAGFV